MNNNYLSKKMFMWVMGIFILAFTTVMSYNIGQLDDTKERFNHSFTEVTSDISSLKTSVDFLVDDSKENRKDIKDIKDILRTF